MTSDGVIYITLECLGSAQVLPTGRLPRSEIVWSAVGPARYISAGNRQDRDAQMAHDHAIREISIWRTHVAPGGLVPTLQTVLCMLQSGLSGNCGIRTSCRAIALPHIPWKHRPDSKRIDTLRSSVDSAVTVRTV